MFDDAIEFIRSAYPDHRTIPLHAPVFRGNEKKYLAECIDSSFVSSVGPFVTRFEAMMTQITGSTSAIATVNGTSALHAALIVAGVGPGDEVITQPVTFVATANAIRYCGADPIFLDVDRSTLGLSPEALQQFLDLHATAKNGGTVNRVTGRRIRACVPVHTFGHPCRIDHIRDICGTFNIPVVEDAAEALGTTYLGNHAGTFGDLGVYSFNGNKSMTAGGGGVIVTDDETSAAMARHLTTTAKVPHPFEYFHDMLGYNYRLPNINAALGCAQLEQMEAFLHEKRNLAQNYREFFSTTGICFVAEPEGAQSNYWLNAVILKSREERDEFIQATNEAGIMTRPLWKLLNRLPMYAACQTGPLKVAAWIEERIVNLPSGVAKA